MVFRLCRWLVEPWGVGDWPEVSRDSGKESLVGTGLAAPPPAPPLQHFTASSAVALWTDGLFLPPFCR